MANRLVALIKLVCKRSLVLSPQSNARNQRFSRWITALHLPDFLMYAASCRRRNRIREYLSRRYIAGKGIEIGAQGNPLTVDPGKAVVTYVDRISVEENAGFHNLNARDLTPVDIYAEADNLAMFEDRSLDFVIANHLLEHVQDPLSSILEWLRILKDDGILFLSVPNYRCNEYDFERKPLGLPHIIADFENDGIDKKSVHWEEFVEIVEGIPRSNRDFLKVLNEQYRSKDNRIHMHVFDNELLESIIDYVSANLSAPRGIQIIDSFCFKYSFEIVFVIRKRRETIGESGFAKTTRFLRNALLVIAGN
jgi:SAM-dependent methyltransferase